MGDELIDIYDENNNYLGIQEMKKIALKKGLWHRGSHVWLYNAQGEILLQLRAKKNKLLSPNRWDISAAGHVSAGEKPLTSGIRELKEELGLKLKNKELDFWKIKKHKGIFRSFKNNVFYYIYFFEFNGNTSQLKLQKEEVQKVKFIPIKKLKEELKSKPKEYVYDDYWNEAINEIENMLNSKNHSF